MAKVNPIVRYMVVCQEMLIRQRHVALIDLVLNVRSRTVPAYPLFKDQICVFVALAEARGRAPSRTQDRARGF